MFIEVMTGQQMHSDRKGALFYEVYLMGILIAYANALCSSVFFVFH